MSVYLSPSNSLGFNRPLTTLVKRALTISNANAQPVAFKVKTTAPKLYCVRPNSGRIEPGQSVEVSVMLQALKEEPPLNAKCKDKFLIQSTVITPEKEDKPLQEIWTVPEGNTDEANKVHQQKLKVVYLPPEGQTLEEEDENVVAQNDSIVNQSGMTTSSQYDTVRQHPVVNGHAPALPEFQLQDASGSNLQHEEEEAHDAPEVPPPVSVFVQPPQPEPVAEPAPAPAPAPAAAIPPIAPDHSEELKQELQEAREEIERLRSLLAAAAPPPELRKRTRRLSDDMTVAGSDVGTMIEEPPMPQEGVPLQVVVIIALGVFITTYLFF